MLDDVVDGTVFTLFKRPNESQELHESKDEQFYNIWPFRSKCQNHIYWPRPHQLQRMLVCFLGFFYNGAKI